ncbi:MAG: polyprenyl synthetase family protein [Actinobacteria bacterium]|nr:polyprenyl synthetase family protein [Actinomycetota bacterium]
MNDAAIERVVADLGAIDQRVRTHIELIIDTQMGPWLQGDNEDVKEVLASYRAMALTSGKRLRPAFVSWAHEGCGGDPSDPAVLDAAVAVELLHTFALIHDDVMDGAVARRGVETIHVTYADRHRRLGQRGEAPHHGESIAILMGDLAFAHAALLMNRVDRSAAALFYEMCAELMVGQYLDIEASARGPKLGAEVADQITELKTAGYTVEGPLLLGAALAGRSEEMAPHVRAYGRPLGHAFQLRDDLLGAYGDPVKTGKPVGDDLAQGKVTRLLEIGLDRGTDEDRALLLRLGSQAMEDGDVERAQEILERSGARASVEELIDTLLAEAVAAAEQAPITQDIRDVLSGAAHLIAHRER